MVRQKSRIKRKLCSNWFRNQCLVLWCRYWYLLDLVDHKTPLKITAQFLKRLSKLRVIIYRAEIVA